jgi:hypothetical protein
MAVAAGIADPDPEVWLSSPIARAHSTTYLRYLSGRHTVAPDQEGQCLKRALENVNLFSLIGFLEDLDAFTRDFEQMFGARLVLHKYNEAKGGKARLTDAQRERLHGMCAADRAIYAHARALGDQLRAVA